MPKIINEMTDEELLEEINRLKSLEVPAAPSQKAPKRPKDAKEGRKPKWQDAF